MSDLILIVDDSLTVRMDLADAFTAAGLRTAPCISIAEARAALARERVGLMILDVLLPDGHGVEFLAEIRALPAHALTPVLMLSSEADVKDRIRGLQTGATEYVGKPYDTGYVVARARELLRSNADEAPPEQVPTILVIEDSLTFREELSDALRQAGYAVIAASSGEEGLRLAADACPAAIMVDGVLPGIDGDTVIRSIRLDAVLRDTPCLLLTGSEDRGGELRALDAGADAFVRKEESLDVVLARLAAVLRNTVASHRGATASLLAPKKILAVDDSPTYLQELADVLRGEGYDAILACSGEEALEMLAVQAVDCILLDLMMPGIGGHETCRRIKTSAIGRDVPLIMLTAVEDRGTMIDGLAHGADDFIQKSSEFEVVKARVRAQIRRKQFEDEHRRVREELLRKELEASEARAAQQLAEVRASLVEELECKNRELEAFSYSVSHDLRAPLRAIDGFSQALEEDCGELLDDNGHYCLTQVRTSARRMNELIDDMLQLSQVGRAGLEREEIDLAAIAVRVVEQLRKAEPERDVAFEAPEHLAARADLRLMRIVFENLLGNAWKFTAKRADAHVVFGAQGDPRGLIYFVRDNGAGFDMDFADKLFRPFQRLHGEAEFSGTGIGLATVQRVIDRHGGRVWAEGKVDHGTTIYFTLATK